LHRRVALKCLISSRLEGDERRHRILGEARAAAGISHPNVATVYDVIEHEGRAFIVMEDVQGESLAARLKRERIPIHVGGASRRAARLRRGAARRERTWRTPASRARSRT